jgi:hypothetical protein
MPADPPPPAAAPMPAAEVDALLAHADLTLTEAERARIREASRFIVEMAARVRTPRAIEAEPAVTFAVREEGR